MAVRVFSLHPLNMVCRLYVKVSDIHACICVCSLSLTSMNKCSA